MYEKWLNRCLVFMKSLWCQLAVTYTLLTFCAMMLLVIMLYGVNDYADFHATLTPENVEKQVLSEKLTTLQAIRDAGYAEWWNKARDNIREKLINLEPGGDGAMYRITNSSRPEVYIEITDRNDQLLWSDPVHLPKKIAAQFATQKKLPVTNSDATRRAENGANWVDTGADWQHSASGVGNGVYCQLEESAMAA